MRRFFTTFLLLVVAFLPLVLCAGVEDLSFDGMVSSHVARLARRDGILPWTRHDTITNDYGRVRLTGSDALAPGRYLLQVRDADGWLEVRDAEGLLVREVAPANDHPIDWLWTLFGLSESERAKSFWRLSYLVSVWEVVPADYVEPPEPTVPAPRRRAPAVPSAPSAWLSAISVSDHVITYVAEWHPSLQPEGGIFDLYACADLANPQWRRVASFSATGTTCHTGTVASASVPGWDAGRSLVHDADCHAVTNVVTAPFGSGGTFTNAVWSCDHRAVSAKPVFLRFGDRTDADHDGMPDCLAGWGGGLDSEYGLFLTGRSQLWYLANYEGVLVSATAADGSPSLALADPSATNLFCMVGVVLGDAEPLQPIRISNENGFAPDGAEFMLAAGVTNRLPLRIGQRYVFGDFWPGDWNLNADDPSVSCGTNLEDWVLSVCRPFRVELTDVPPPDDAPRCSLGHVHRRYCRFVTDPDVPGTLSLYDTNCITVDNATRTLSVAQSWAPGHVSGSSLLEQRGATGEYVTSDGIAQIVLDNLCPHSLGGVLACRCGVTAYCPECIGATAEWYNRTYGTLLTATDAADGSVSVTWKDGVCSAAYYWVEVTAPDRAATVTVTPEEPTALGGCRLTLSSGRPARIPFLAGVRYTVETRYAALTFVPDDAEVVVANPSNRFYTLERPLSFSVARTPEGESSCSEGHVHNRRYCIVPSVDGLEGCVSLEDMTCFTTNGTSAFTVRCTGEPGPACATNGVVAGTFAYEGAVRPFAIPAEICRCDDLRRPVCPCGEGSLCDTCDDTAYGQDDNWVRINFASLLRIDPTLADVGDILSVGYANWVDQQVGVGLTNGLYKFTALFEDDPPEPTQLYIGDYSVCVTNAGEYVFVLEKGEEYEFGTWPFNDDVDYWAQDDLAADAPMLTAWWGGWEAPGEWTIDGGWVDFWRPDLFEWGYQNGYCCMMPTLQGSPAVTHLGPEDFPITFDAILSDIPQNCEVSYEWSADAECLDIESPRSKITQVRPKNMPSWNSTSMSVTSRFKNKSLTSTVSSLTYGTNSIPTAKLTLSFPDVTFLNDDLRSDRVYPLDVHFSMEVPTNGTIRISHSGDDQVIVSDTNSFSKVYSNPCVTFSSKGKKNGLARRFYVLSRNVGTGSFTATCELADRSRIVQQKGYSVIEPICHYVCNRKGDEGRFLNPSRLVYGTNSYFEVEVRGPYVKTQLVWSVTSGMCDTTKMAWNKVRLKPNVTNGVVKLTAKFTNDGHQPCFELPIVTPRVIPVRAFTVPPRRGAVPVSPTRIRRCLALANEIYSQVGVSFNLISITQNIRTTNDWLVAEYDVDPRTSPTNSPTVSAQALSLLNHYTANDCLELYFVGQIRNSGAVAFRHPKGIVISQEATDHTVAHEIGHAFGLLDIYDYSDVNARVHEQFKLIKPSRGKFSSSRDWGDTFGRGFYPKEVSHSTLMRRMLMFGKDGEASLDIPDGAVFSLQHNHTQSISQTNMPPVGASFMIQSNRGVYSK